MEVIWKISYNNEPKFYLLLLSFHYTSKLACGSAWVQNYVSDFKGGTRLRVRSIGSDDGILK
jgi:hypothetical protein